MNTKAWLLAPALLSIGAAQAACFSVYRADGTLLQESSITPVNLAQPIGDTVPAKFGPGATMTVSEHGYYCRDRREEAQALAQKSLAGALAAEEQKATQMVIKQPAP